MFITSHLRTASTLDTSNPCFLCLALSRFTSLSVLCNANRGSQRSINSCGIPSEMQGRSSTSRSSTSHVFSDGDDHDVT